MNRSTILYLANSADAGIPFIGAANGYAVDGDGWLTIPYGDSRHSGNDGLKVARAGDPEPKPVIQRFTREDAIALVNHFNSAFSRFKRAVVGAPIFKGHPDAPRYAKKFPDLTPRGTIAEMQVGDAGLRIKPVLTEQGAADVEAGWNEVSPYWALKVVAETAAERIASPFKLFSLGLVPEGNIQGLSLTNAAEPQNSTEEAMNKHLIELLAALGITLAANATEDDAKKAVAEALPKITLANEAVTKLPDLQGKVTKLESEVVTLTNAKTKAEGEVVNLTNAKTEAATKLAAERKARATLVVSQAIADGRVAGAALEAEVLGLVNAADFDVAAKALAARPPVLKTKGNLGNLGQAAVASQDRQQQIVSLVNSAMESPDIKGLPPGERYDAAFNLVRKNPAHAALWPKDKA